LLQLKVVLVTGECFRDSPTRWFPLSTFIKHSIGPSEANLDSPTLYKWTLLKFVSVYRTPLTIYLRAHLSLHIRQLEKGLETFGARNKEDLSAIVKEAKKGIFLGSRGHSRTLMMQDLHEEWSSIKSADPQIQA